MLFAILVKVFPDLTEPTFLQKEKLILSPNNKELLTFYHSHLLFKSLSALGRDQLPSLCSWSQPKQHKL